MDENQPQKQSLNSEDVCFEFLGGCNKSTLWRLRQKDATFPKPFDFGGRPFWNRADMQAWYDTKRKPQTSLQSEAA